VKCQKDGSFNITAKCTKSPFSDALLKYKNLFLAKLKLIRQAAERATKVQNDPNKDATADADCKNSTYKEYRNDCWKPGTRCEKIIQEFEKGICNRPGLRGPPPDFPKCTGADVEDDIGNLESASCTEMMEELKNWSKNIAYELRKMDTPSDSQQKLKTELNKGREETVQILAKLMKSMQFLPQSNASYPAQATWLDAVRPVGAAAGQVSKRVKDAAKTTIKNFKAPVWKLRANLEGKGTAALGNYRPQNNDSTLLALNCAPAVPHIHERLTEEEFFFYAFREVEEDAPQKPSHIVLSA